ncbi:very-long-chain (3R)-3-hydroxyacyl-CoA dehydratase 2-like [Ruditapes philippinarum]|uniref:very-long-chain (3R)-3-hydroxyacyl-CoA dehydratase 2-like n=1 Tax=Ruditapes philippinarum TaxID=129788 RepID=UPI00295BC4F0|nr:very-long-chain (3R)-3-hydroxyacyl-CoA dehydratase 2-like [Ruditapes philippinarum]
MPSSASKQESKEQNPVILSYLIAYNVAQVMGWSAIFFIFLSHFYSERTSKGLYDKVAPLLNIFQTAAVLEILHCALGFVRSSVMLTAFQVFSRVMLTWGVAYSIVVVQNVTGVSMFVFAWSVTEIIRYAFYMFSLIGEVPYTLQWCRYTFFIVLYPIGVTGELLSIWSGLDFVRESKMYSVELPNAANMSFSYFYFLIFFMIMYIPVFPQLYMHMLAQRNKVIGGAGKSKKE